MTVPPGASVYKTLLWISFSTAFSYFEETTRSFNTSPLILPENAACQCSSCNAPFGKVSMGSLYSCTLLARYESPDFNLFPVLNEALIGRRYHDLDELSAAVKARVRVIEKDRLCRGIEKLPDRWQAIIDKERGLYRTLTVFDFSSFF